jgi:hypothetical protein
MPKISELNAITSVANNDLLMVVHDPSGLPSTNKITVNNFITSVSTQLRGYTGSTGVGFTGSAGTGGGSSLPVTGQSNGYVLSSNSTNGAEWTPNPDVVRIAYVDQFGQNAYTANPYDSVILVDPTAVGNNVTVSLPLASAIAGHRVTVKNINTGGPGPSSPYGYTVTVTTTNPGSNYIEHPVTGNFVTSYELRSRADGLTWIHDGDIYRHVASESTEPVFYTDADTYAQVVFKNASSANNASSDLVGYNDAGDEEAGTGPFIDMGINSSNYTNTYFGNVWGPNDSYLYNYGGNLIIGPQTSNTIKFIAGGTDDENVRMVISPSADLIVNSSIRGTSNFNIHTPYVLDANVKYSETYFGAEGYWGGYVELDAITGNNSWSWIETNLTDANDPYVLIENKSDDGRSKTWRFNIDGSLSLPGGFRLPSESHVGYRYNSTITGRTLRLSNDLTGEVIVTGPSANSSYPDTQRIIIQGQRGYGTWGQNTAGEGGDIYIWAGVGGESDTGVGGTGGDIKVRGGQGQDAEGGYLRIEAGDAAHWGSSPGNGGFIEITAGSVIEGGGDANNVGGDVTISAGKGRYYADKSGAVRIRAGGSISSPAQHEWIFNANNVLTLPADSDIKNSDGYSVIKSIPQNQQSGFNNYTLQLSDAGKHIYKDDGDGYGVEIPTDATTTFEIGTVITIVSGNGWTYIYPADGMTTELWGAGFNQTSTSFYIPNNSMATLLKIGADKWMLSGAGLAID